MEAARRCDRACPRAPWRARCGAPRRVPRCRRCARARAAGTAARSGAETSARRRTRRAARHRTRGTVRAFDRARWQAARRQRQHARSAPCRRSVRLAADSTTLVRSVFHARAISSSTSTNPGRCQRDVGREVRAAVEGLQLGRQPHAHRPAARARRGLHERHVHPIHVGALLAIHLDRDELAIEHGGDLVVLERLVLHDVAPVARRVADRQEDRLVLQPRASERLVAPRIPVHRVVRVLQEVRTLLGGQSIRHVSSIAVAKRGPANG